MSEPSTRLSWVSKPEDLNPYEDTLLLPGVKFVGLEHSLESALSSFPSHDLVIFDGALG